MKTSLLTLLLLAAPAFAFAQSAEPAPAQDASNQQAASQDLEAQANHDARRDCMRYTGSRIVSNRAERKAQSDAAAAEKVGELDRDDCIAAHGSVYSRSDLRRTGEVDIADALRKLDPAIR